MKFKKVKDFVYEGRRCIVTRCDLSKIRKKLKINKSSSLYDTMQDYSNGYVELYPFENNRDIEKYHGENLTGQEITFEGHLKEENDKTIFIGFDTNHLGDTEITKSVEAVKQGCKDIVNELNNKMDLLDYKKLLELRRKQK